MGRILKIRDLTLRDGQQSLFATRMKQENIDKLLPLYKEAHFYIMEVWGGAVPDSVMRYLGESPWDRLRECSKAMKGISLLSALSRGRNLFGYVPYPESVLEGFYREAIKDGLNIMRIFDALNDIDNIKSSIKMINDLGGIADTAVCYTIDPKGTADDDRIFTDEYFVNLAIEMEKLGAKMITLKDMAGLVNPSRIFTLMPKLKAALNVPVDFHTHCTPGYGLASVLTAIIQGVDIVDTNIWWFGGGSAAPAIELVDIFCQKLGITLDADMAAVAKIRQELKEARKSLADYDLNKDKWQRDFEEAYAAMPKEIDAEFDRAIECAKDNREDELLDACHKIDAYFGFPKPNEIVKNAEVPGGMYSNMVANLRALQAEDVIEEAMALIPKVRRDAGLVPLVTPTSQIVGSQAVSLALDRRNGKPDYTTKSNQFISLVKGEYGKTPVEIDPEFRKKITGDSTEKPFDVSSYKKPDNPTLDSGVKLAKNEEEFLLLELLPSVAKIYLTNLRKAESAAKSEEVKNGEIDNGVVGNGPLLLAPMGGTVLAVNVKPGDTVKAGDKVLVYEAMKMENDLVSEMSGKVKNVFVREGDVMATAQPLIEFEGENTAPAAASVTNTDSNTLLAPMGGTIIEFKVKPGDKIKAGDILLVYEAMKMENNLLAERDGMIESLLLHDGDVMATAQPILTWKPLASSEEKSEKPKVATGVKSYDINKALHPVEGGTGKKPENLKNYQGNISDIKLPKGSKLDIKMDPDGTVHIRVTR